MEGNKIILQKWKEGMIADDFANTNINVWVHIHRLPFELRRNKFAKTFVAPAGKIKEPKTREK